MHIWAITNQSGGVGKTTGMVNLGGVLAGQGRRAALLDLDPYGSLSAYLGIEPDLDGGHVYAVFAAPSPFSGPPFLALIHCTAFDNLDLLPRATQVWRRGRPDGKGGPPGPIMPASLPPGGPPWHCLACERAAGCVVWKRL